MTPSNYHQAAGTQERLLNQDAQTPYEVHGATNMNRFIEDKAKCRLFHRKLPKVSVVSHVVLCWRFSKEQVLSIIFFEGDILLRFL
jgi:hypothetical protein